MSDVQGGEAATVETTSTTAPEAVVSSSAPAERDYETEAREQGWRPKDEWTGKPDNWKDARSYVEFGDPIRRIEKAFDARVAKLEKVTERNIAALKAQHAKELAEATAERRVAIKAGDVAAVEKLDQHIETLKDNEPTVAATDADGKRKSYPKPDSPEQAELVRNFGKQNRWYVEEPEMADYAEKFSQRNASINPEISFEDNQDATVAAVRKKFPAYFQNGGGETRAAANGHAAVDGGGSYPGTVRNDPLSKLPNEARKQAAMDMKNYPKIYPNAAAWIAVYEAK